MDKGVVVDIGNDIEGFVPMSQLGVPDIENPGDAVKEGQPVDLKVLEVDPIHHRIVLAAIGYPDEPSRSHRCRSSTSPAGRDVDGGTAVSGETATGVDQSLAASRFCGYRSARPCIRSPAYRSPLTDPCPHPATSSTTCIIASAAAEQGGGADRIAQQHKKGKLTARERLDLLLDPGQLRRARPVRHPPRHRLRPRRAVVSWATAS